MPAETPRADEVLITTHRILASLDTQHRGLPSLHADLFDARPAVALSAISTAGTIADASSFPHLARLLSAADEDLQCAAIAAMARNPHPEKAGTLRGLLRTTQSDRLREAVLEAIADAGLGDAETADLARRTAHSALVPPAARANAAGVLLAIAGPDCLDTLIAEGREEVLARVLERAVSRPEAASRVLRLMAPGYRRLPARLRAALASFAAAIDAPESISVLHAALADTDPEARRAVYVAVGTYAHHGSIRGPLIDALAERAEALPSLEEEAAQAVARLAALPHAAAVSSEIRERIRRRIAELYTEVGTSSHRVASDSHELGWIIRRTCEYLEYYADDDLKAAVIRHLRGIGAIEVDELLRRLKATAVRVEVRHFDGYSALQDLIRNPRRSGAGLIMREISQVHPGKARRFGQLVRNLNLAAQYLGPEASAEAPGLEAIYTWARQERLFRLAEAALAALARVAPARGVALGKACLAPPVSSKILAIASLHLLAGLDPATLEPAAAALLAGPEDVHLALNAIEAIGTLPPTSNGQVAAALIGVMRRTANRELLENAAACLGEKLDVDITAGLSDLYKLGSPLPREAALICIDRQIGTGRLANREGTAEFLYRILREAAPVERGRAAALLWKLGDDYSLEVIRDLLATAAPPERATLLLALRGHLRPSLVPALEGPLADGHPLVQEALRELVLDATGEAREAILSMAIALGGETHEDEDAIGDTGKSAGVELHGERERFRFEREHITELTVLFTDIVGYSKKAQALPPMQLAALLQEYERILVAVVSAHRGELVKRMGDGHMFVFTSPLSAVLAAIRVQKSLRRFNRYREEVSRVAIRIGVHCGKVVRKDSGDVLGNTVNVASRLETAAQSGSILISEELHERVKDAVHAREIGAIEVKNISGAIRVFEPYEIALDLSPDQDPLRQARAAATPSTGAAPSAPRAAPSAPRAAPSAPAAAPSTGVSREALAEIARTFKRLNEIVKSIEAGEPRGAELRQEIAAGWKRLRTLLGASTTPENRSDTP